MQKDDFKLLDTIRGIAALYVVIAHCRGVLWLGGSEFVKLFPRNTWDTWDTLKFGTSMLTRLAVEFVIVFFVLSGFSIAHSLSSNQSPVKFYKRRLIRIYPSYLAALGWAAVIFLVTRAVFPQWYDGTYTQFAFIRTMEMNEFFHPKVVAGNLFYMPMHGFIGPFWSLTYEVMFYLMAPFLLRRVNWYAAFSLLLFGINFLFPEKVFNLNLPVYIYEFLFIYNIYFVVGVYLYTHYQTVAGWFVNYTKLEFTLIFAGLLLFMYGANIYLKIETVFTFIEAAMLSVVLIVFFLKYKMKVPWLMGIGKFSYSLYITHFATVYLYLALYWFITGRDAPYITNFFVWILGVFFCLGLGWLHYWVVERNTQKILTRLRKPATDK